jgi:hypothetical protein
LECPGSSSKNGGGDSSFVGLFLAHCWLVIHWLIIAGLLLANHLQDSSIIPFHHGMMEWTCYVTTVMTLTAK